MLFHSVRRQIVALDHSMKKSNTMGLDERLMQDLLLAGLRVPVFNERQKASLFLAAKADGVKNIPLSSKCWPFDALTRRSNLPEEAIAVCRIPVSYTQTPISLTNLSDSCQQLASFMAEGSKVHAPGTDLLVNKWTQEEHSASGGMFGKVWFEWGRGITHHKLQFAVDHEMQIVRDIAKALAQAELKKRNF